MPFKMPGVPDEQTCAENARKYAEASADYTSNYARRTAIDDPDKQQRQIIRGRYVQEWLAVFLTMNGISFDDERFSYDRDHPKIPDEFDIEIHGYRCDVKGFFPGFNFQVFPKCKEHRVAYYIFFELNGMLTTITPSGVITYEDYWVYAKEVHQGEQIPNSAELQGYGSSFFLEDQSKVIPFERWMTTLQNESRRARNDVWIERLEHLSSDVKDIKDMIKEIVGVHAKVEMLDYERQIMIHRVARLEHRMDQKRSRAR